MTIPNLITIARLIIVPFVIVMIMQQRWSTAFVLFVLAGVSDAVDGFIARHFDMRSELGAYLDPIADKALLVSIYVTLAFVGAIPGWLAIVVVSRDAMIVGGRAPVLGHEPPGRDQAASREQDQHGGADRLRGLRARRNAFGAELAGLEDVAMLVVAALTVASAGAYLGGWLRHMAA